MHGETVKFTNAIFKVTTLRIGRAKDRNPLGGGRDIPHPPGPALRPNNLLYNP